MIKLLRITHPEIAWHTASMMLHVFGAAALLSFIVSMHWYLWLPDILCLTICFYSGYYFELGFRTRRFQEFRYGAPEPPKVKISIKDLPNFSSEWSGGHAIHHEEFIRESENEN